MKFDYETRQKSEKDKNFFIEINRENFYVSVLGKRSIS